MELPPAATRAYQSNRFWTCAVLALIGLYELAILVTLVGQKWLRCVIAAGDDLSAPFNHFVNQLQFRLAQASWTLEIASAIAFLIWLHRAFANLPALGSTKREIAPGQRATPGAAVGGWFIPFANFVLGYRTVRHLWRESQPATAVLPDGSMLPKRNPLVAWWWGLFLMRNLSYRVAKLGGGSTRTLEAWAARTERMIVPGLIDIAAAVLCILVVRTIEQRQREQHRDLMLQVSPPPPTDRLR
jgi:Domain of unknown function (DUF4328)